MLGALALGATAPRGVVGADPVADDAGTLDSKLGRVLGAPGGLTSDVVASPAEATSFDVQVQTRPSRGPRRGGPGSRRLTSRSSPLARYTRLSPIESAAFGTLVAAPSATPGPIPRWNGSRRRASVVPRDPDQYLVRRH